MVSIQRILLSSSEAIVLRDEEKDLKVFVPRQTLHGIHLGHRVEFR